MKRIISLFLVISIVLTIFSGLTLTSSASDDSLPDLTKDIQNMEFYAARDMYLGFGNIDDCVAAKVTFKNGKTFIYDFGYSYEYDYDYDDGGYNYNLCNEFILYCSELGYISFDTNNTLSTPGTVTINVTCSFSCEYNKTFSLNVVESPVDSIEITKDIIDIYL